MSVRIESEIIENKVRLVYTVLITCFTMYGWVMSMRQNSFAGSFREDVFYPSWL